jgi:hypothetical protein
MEIVLTQAENEPRLSILQPLTLLRMVSSEMLRRVALVRTDVSEELSASFIRLTRICELGTTLAVTSNRRTLRRTDSCHPGEGGAKLLRNVGSYKSNRA